MAETDGHITLSNSSIMFISYNASTPRKLHILPDHTYKTGTVNKQLSFPFLAEK